MKQAIRDKQKYMKTITKRIAFTTTTQIAFVDLTDDVREIVSASGVREGIVTVFAPHTTMGVTVNHNEPMLLQDFTRMLYRFSPVDDQYAHDVFELRRGSTADGRSNGHSHCKAIITGTGTTVPVIEGAMVLSRIQSIFAVDFDGPRSRDVVVQVMGD